MKHSLPLIFALLLVIACKPTVPSKYIQPDDMEDLLYDYHISQAMAKNDGSDEESYRMNMYFLAVLKKHQVSEADFDSSLVYYYSHVDRLKDIYSHVNDRLADAAKDIGASVGAINQYSQYSATGDTANIWNQATDVLLIPRVTKNRFEFTFKGDSTYRVGDSFMFQFMTEYIYQSGTRDAVVCLVAKYEGDSILQVVNHVSSPGISQVRIPANHNSNVKEILGYVYLANGDDAGDLRKLMFISQMQMIRFHSKEIEIAKTDEAEELPASVKEDSVQRAPHAARPVPDTLRRRTLGRMRGRELPIERRTAVHRVDAGPDRVKK